MALELAPHTFVRGLTAGLAAFWTLRAIARLMRAIVQLDGLACEFGLSRGLVISTAWRVLLRATLFDPSNLFLILLLGGVVWLGEVV